jgi:predicted Zn-dependent protease
MRKLIITTSVFLLILSTGCQTLMEGVGSIGAAVGQATGTMTPQQADSLKKTSSAIGKAAEKFSPEQEYYVGRSIGAIILKTYKPYNNSALTGYINVLGQTLAAASDKPETFKGYHFLVLDTDEINAFAAPGGLIFVSRGLIKCCKNEDALAAVLAHEVGHVQLEHGIKAIGKSRMTSALTTIAAEGAKSFGPSQVAELTKTFEGALSDITSKLIDNGYARKLETQADEVAVTIMQRVGYNPAGLKDMLLQMDKLKKPGKGFSKTHPDPMDRIKDIEKLIKSSDSLTQPVARKTRFQKAVASL